MQKDRLRFNIQFNTSHAALNTHLHSQYTASVLYKAHKKWRKKGEQNTEKKQDDRWFSKGGAEP